MPDENTAKILSPKSKPNLREPGTEDRRAMQDTAEEHLDRAAAAAAETAIARRRTPLKSRSGFNDRSGWKHKLRENCYRRVREDRGRLLWKMRLPDSEPCTSQEYIKSAFRDIVSDELKKIKSTSVADSLKTVHGTHEQADMLWEYDGLHNAYQGDCEEILLEMQRIFYEDLDSEQNRKESESCVDNWEDEEDELLACAVFEHMQLTEDEVSKRVWCPICKQGELQENHSLIYCTLCNLKLNKGTEINLDLLRFRLAEAHSEHLDRGCRLKPNFSVETIIDLTALYLVCSGCQTFEVVV
ncbi:hypothetical protein ACJRO7_008066 [Eucalyptus globulus]|uniref:RPA-interacting protein n=1 Tax=Eucalyptus globulus TaxID=34317 RepID=A0ABD3IQF9_EUCGL